tara:strand:+ start:101 stop:502 length:402 start_codon:yes stop_codon:yes gene_type:complete
MELEKVADPRKRVQRLNSEEHPDLGYCVSGTLKRVFNRRALEDADALEAAMKATADVAKFDVKQSTKHQFEPSGASCVLVLGESHFACHTWPEHGMATFTVYTCNGAGQAMCGVRAFMREMETSIVKIIEFRH